MAERIGRYDLVTTLAEGDRGKLYLARQTGFGGFARHVVIKTFEQLPGAAEGPFIEETLDLGRLHHQHITPVLDVGRDGERFYVALDFVHGRSAREVWQQTFTLGALLPLDFALTVVAAVASGLHYAHTRRKSDGSPLGLVHGHVSLSNVVIGFDGSVQLIGFAGASARGLRASETQLGFAKDQLAYLAPEQARRIGLDARSDVFALGTILYELTTMRRAFRDDSDRLTIERVKIGSYVKPRAVIPDYPVELERIVTRALQIDPDARYPNAEMLRRELVAVGHHLGYVLGDAAIVEVMAQLFEDSAVDPWTSARADTTPDALAPDATPAARKKPLRAATETVDALAIELEIPLDHVDGVLAKMGATGDVPAIPAAGATTAPAVEDDTRATMPTAALADAPAAPASGPSMADTDGVPVLQPLPTPPRAATPPETPVAAKPIAPPSPARRIDFRIVAIVAAVVTIGVTTALALALRGADAKAKPGDASVASGAPVAVDAAPPIDAAIDAAIDAPPPDASTTVRLQITSTPPNATVLLDGKRLGKTPFDGTVDRAAGPHVLKLRLGGYNTLRVDLDLEADVAQDLVLVKAAPADAGAPDEPQAPPKTDLDVPD